jgi:hypothetical protein
MRGNLTELAPTPVRDREPITETTEVVNSHYTTAIIGGNSAGPAKGWEAIQPKTTTKPVYLLQAQTALQSRWLDYLASIDAGHDQGTIEDAWDRYEAAKLKCEAAWDACEAGHDPELAAIPY